jgi:hypothetical protein
LFTEGRCSFYHSVMAIQVIRFIHRSSDRSHDRETVAL